jgi:hypothetical protein
MITVRLYEDVDHVALITVRLYEDVDHVAVLIHSTGSWCAVK